MALQTNDLYVWWLYQLKCRVSLLLLHQQNSMKLDKWISFTRRNKRNCDHLQCNLFLHCNANQLRNDCDCICQMLLLMLNCGCLVHSIKYELIQGFFWQREMYCLFYWHFIFSSISCNLYKKYSHICLTSSSNRPSINICY